LRVYDVSQLALNGGYIAAVHRARHQVARQDVLSIG
jgi:hypothetical protein